MKSEDKFVLYHYNVSGCFVAKICRCLIRILPNRTMVKLFISEFSENIARKHIGSPRWKQIEIEIRKFNAITGIGKMSYYHNHICIIAQYK